MLDKKISDEKLQSDIDNDNSIFWNELCGTTLAKKLSINNDSVEDLMKFDKWYFDHYPYLNKYIPFGEMSGKNVLEIGLGYGTVSQKIIISGANYFGLDIARGPVEMIKKRLSFLNLKGSLVQDSILSDKLPFIKGDFDFVVAIGCLHHTGNLKKAIENVYQLLKPGGQAVIMVYNALSYRQWYHVPIASIKKMFKINREININFSGDEKMRAAYDTNIAGLAAPQTEFATRSELRLMCNKFKSISIYANNVGNESILSYFSRTFSCKVFGPFLGLDLYCVLKK